MPHKASSGSSGTQTHGPVPTSLGPIRMSLFLGSGQRKPGWVDQRQLRTPLPQQDSKRGGGTEPQVRSCQSPCSARAARFPAPSGGAGHARGWGGGGGSAGRWLGCYEAWSVNARGGGAQGGVNAQEDGGGGEMREGLGEGCAGWRNSSRESDIHNLSTLLLLLGLLEEPETPPSPVCLRPSH